MHGIPSRSQEPNIRAVILDYGEVLSHPPDRGAIAVMAGVLAVPVERFLRLYGSHRYPYDRGDLSGEQYWLALAAEAGVSLTSEQIDHLRQTDVAMWSNLNPVMLRWAGELRQSGIRTAVLSNMHQDMVAFARAQFEWLASFDCMVLSSELRMAKPDAEIFHYCLHCLEVQAHEALFVDDREPNVQAARALGIVALCANSPDSLRKQLQLMGWPAPLPG